MEEPKVKHQSKMKTRSTGKTARMMEEVGSPANRFFPKRQLKKMYPPGSSSSAYTEDSPLPNLHHPDYKRGKKPKGLFDGASGDTLSGQ